MKLKLSFLALVIGQISYAQSSNESSINNTNYYSHFQDIKGHSINWLRSADALPTIIDELLKKGVAYHTIQIGNLVKLNDSTRFVVTISFKKAEKEYGFLYAADHSFPINQKDRSFLTDRKKAFYLQVERVSADSINFIGIKQLPENIFLLKETVYWFQYDNKATKYDVSKEVAQNILRQDVDDYLNKL